MKQRDTMKKSKMHTHTHANYKPDVVTSMIRNSQQIHAQKMSGQVQEIGLL